MHPLGATADFSVFERRFPAVPSGMGVAAITQYSVFERRFPAVPSEDLVVRDW